MDEELERVIELQLKFQEAVTNHIETQAKLFTSMDERIKTCHERMNAQNKQVDTLIDIIIELKSQLSVLEERININNNI